MLPTIISIQRSDLPVFCGVWPPCYFNLRVFGYALGRRVRWAGRPLTPARNAVRRGRPDPPLAPLAGCRPACLRDRAPYSAADRELLCVSAASPRFVRIDPLFEAAAALMPAVRAWPKRPALAGPVLLAMLAWVGAGPVLAATGDAAAPAAPHHVNVDAAAYPWSSIAKLFNSVGGSCTGAVVGRSQILTAGHCLYNFRTHRFLPPDAIHALLGYQRGALLHPCSRAKLTRSAPATIRRRRAPPRRPTGPSSTSPNRCPIRSAP